MTQPTATLAALALFTLALATPGHADSVASSASSAGSASLGSLSDSIGHSSDSSTGGRQVADGDYRVIDVAEPAPGRLRITLRGVEAGAAQPAEFTLSLPQQALGARALGAGDLVNVRQRPYGLEFAHAANAAQAREPFFLALADAWRREIDPRAIGL